MVVVPKAGQMEGWGRSRGCDDICVCVCVCVHACAADLLLYFVLSNEQKILHYDCE